MKLIFVSVHSEKLCASPNLDNIQIWFLFNFIEIDSLDKSSSEQHAVIIQNDTQRNLSSQLRLDEDYSVFVRVQAQKRNDIRRRNKEASELYLFKLI